MGKIASCFPEAEEVKSLRERQKIRRESGANSNDSGWNGVRAGGFRNVQTTQCLADLPSANTR